MKEITKFWNWFQDNEEAIKNALIFGTNAKEVFYHLDRNFFYISRRIGYSFHWSATGKTILIFTAGGYTKVFPKIAALEDQAPHLNHFKIQGFIKPITNFEPFIKGIDCALVFENYKFKISKLYFSILDYNTITKQLVIKLHIPKFESIKHCQELKMDITFILMYVIGEIAYKKHIKSLEIEQLPESTNSLIKLFELPQYIEHLYQVK